MFELDEDESSPRRRNRLLERMCVIDVGDGVLEGLMQSGSGLAVLLVPHVGGGPLCMSGAVCAEIVWRLANANAHTLRFDYRGFGASSGERALPLDATEIDDATLTALAADAAAAYDVLRETCNRPVSVVGVGLGAQVAACVCAGRPVRSFCAVLPDPRLTLAHAPEGQRATRIGPEPVDKADGYAHIESPGADFGAGAGLTALSSMVLDALGVAPLKRNA